MNSRRDALKTAALVATIAPAAFAQTSSAPHQHGGDSPTAAPLSKPKFFSAGDIATLTALCEQIIPRSDTPGAADAGVPLLIDANVARRPELQKLYSLGLANLNKASRDSYEQPFAKLTSDQQIALLTPISRDAISELGLFFKLVKDHTIDTYYSTREGLVTELGWHANTYVTEFVGCTHKEHQV